MALRADPDLALRPLGEVAQFLNLGMANGRFIRKWQSRRIEDPHLASKTFEQPTDFKGKQTAIRYLAE